MPEVNGDHPATRADLRALEEKVERRLQEQKNEIVSIIKDALLQLKTELTASLNEGMQEFVRDTQTELLRGFHAYSSAFDTRVGKVTADLSILDAATERRLVNLERRMLEVEMRLPPLPPPPTS